MILFIFCLAASADANDDDATKWMQQFNGIFPFLLASFFIIFGLHLNIFPQLATHTLMKDYLEEGQVIEGQVLSSETKAGSGGGTFLTDVVYEVREHKYADNPSLKFRNPEAYETKLLRRRFEFDYELPRGQVVEILLPSDPNFTRSGMPRIVVERILNEYSHTRVLMILIPGLILLGVCIAMSIRGVLLMENQALGWCVLCGCLGLSFLVSFLYCSDTFLKSKRRRFDSARAMVRSAEQANNNAERQQASRQQLLDPFAVSFHEFAGPTQATGRRADSAIR